MLDQVIADCHHHVGILKAGHLVVPGLQADRPERVGILIVEQPLGHERLGHRNPGHLGERAQGAGRAGADRPVAGQGDRILGGVDDLGRALELTHARLGLDGRAAGQRFGVELLGHHVLGQLEVGGPRLLGLGDLERLAHDLGNDLGAGDACVPLHDRAQDADQVDVLVGLLVHALEVGLPGQRDERRAIKGRVGHGGDQVGRAGAEGAEAHAGSAGQAPVGIGHVRAALLVPDGHELDRRVGQGLVQVQRLLAGNAEYVPDALGLEALDEHIGSSARRHLSLVSNRIVPGQPFRRSRTRRRPRLTFTLVG